jgi:hypothetical protein
VAEDKTATPKDSSKKTAPRGHTPLVAILVMIAAVGGGAFLRFPDASRLDASKSAMNVEARESVEAAHSLLEGHGLTVKRNGNRAPSRLAAGETATVAASYVLFGKKPESPLYLQWLLSSGAILLAALAGTAIAGGWGGACASILLAVSPEQIESVRSVSPTPALTCLGVLAICCMAVSLKKAAPGFVGLFVAGIAAALAASVHPLFMIFVPAMFLASLLRLSGKALGGLAVGVILGFVPLWIHRSASYGNPLVSSERFAAVEGTAGFEQFQGTAGTRLADWLGVEAASGSLAFDRGYFEHIYQNPGQAALWAVAALGAIGILFSAARAVLAFALASAAALIAVPALWQHAPGLPQTRATEAMMLLACAGAASASVLLRKIPVLGTLLALLLAAAPGVAPYQRFLAAAKSAPGLLSPAPAQALPVAPPGPAKAAAQPEKPPVADTPRQPDIKKLPVENHESAAPKPERALKPASAADLAAVRKIIDGEGGMTKPSAAMEGTSVVLTLKIDHKNIDAAMAATDAARMSIKVFRDHPALDHLIVKIYKADGALSSSSKVFAERVKPFIEKLDDPFEARRARDWWPQIRIPQ